MAALVQADIYARRGAMAAALEALARGKSGFAQLEIEEGLNREFEGRVLRLIGRPDPALAALEDGLRLAAQFPVEAAWLQHERVLTQQARGDPAAARAAALDVRAMLPGMPPHVPRLRAAQPLT
jgi:hypothetical protein